MHANLEITEYAYRREKPRIGSDHQDNAPERDFGQRAGSPCSFHLPDEQEQDDKICHRGIDSVCREQYVRNLSFMKRGWSN